MNYGELKEAVELDSHRRDTATLDQIPRYIRECEGLLFRRLRSSEQDATVTLTDADRGGDATSDLYTLPVGILQIRRVAYGTLELSPRGPGNIRERASGQSVAYYADLGTRLQIRGTPPADAELVLDYFGRLASLSDDSDTNVILTNHEVLYKSGALYYLFQSTQDLELADVHKAHFDDELNALNEEAGRKLGGAGAGNSYDFGAGGSY